MGELKLAWPEEFETFLDRMEKKDAEWVLAYIKIVYSNIKNSKNIYMELDELNLHTKVDIIKNGDDRFLMINVLKAGKKFVYIFFYISETHMVIFHWRMDPIYEAIEKFGEILKNE